MKQEIRFKKRKLQDIERRLTTEDRRLQDCTNWIDYTYLKTSVYKGLRGTKQKIKVTQDNKLKRLGLKKRSVNTDVIFNFSSRLLTETETSALSHGLQFTLPPKRLDYSHHLFSFESLHYNTPTNENSSHFHRQLRHLAYSSFYSFRPTQIPNGLTNEEHEALLGLSKDQTIIILRPDKGNGVVILNRIDYDEKINNLLADQTKFKKLDTNTDKLKLILKLEGKLTRFLRKLKTVKTITDELFNTLKPTGSYLGRLYGLPKTHKSQIPLRPILSAVNTFNHKLAKSLVKILLPFTPNQ